MIIRILLIASVSLSVAGCSRLGIGNWQGRDRVAFDGVEFRGAAKSSDSRSRQHFVSTVKGASQSLEGAISAAEYEGTRHCIRYYGSSEISWDVGPDTPRDALVIENDTVTLIGTCIEN
ncbi:MAG: hypothetical protein N4A70_11990 [Pelagimonas sp.]|jgi:hypothetical protein|nr:hypothetical protein [Pelagimonas sp.]